MSPSPDHVAPSLTHPAAQAPEEQGEGLSVPGGSLPGPPSHLQASENAHE